MRHFPGAQLPCALHRRLLAAVAIATLGLAVLVPLANADDLHDRQDKVQRSIKHAQASVEESSAAVRSATAKLERAKQELASARAHLASVKKRLDAARTLDRKMAARLKSAQAKLDAAQAALAAAQDDAAAQREAVRDTVSSIYSQGDPRLIAFSNLLESGSTEELTRRDSLNDAIVDRQAQVYTQLETVEQQLADREDDVQAATDAVAQERAEAARNLATMKSLTAQAKQAKAIVQKLVQTRADIRHKAWKALHADRGTLQNLRDREDRIRRQILAQQRRAGGGVSVNSDGFLLPPVIGPITSPYGWRIHPIYGYWGLHDGTDFGVSCGEGMRAAGDGVVTQRYWSDVYGNRLYVSLGSVNGKNLTVVYNHASGYRVNVGDRVTRGEIVGYVGSTGWSTGCHLHFEVLVNGTAVDPENWL